MFFSLLFSCTETYPMLQTIETEATNLNTHCPITMIFLSESVHLREKNKSGEDIFEGQMRVLLFAVSHHVTRGIYIY